MEYLIFIERGVWFAICVAIYIWGKKGAKRIDKPIELEDGKFAIPKPEDEFMEGVEYDEVITDPKFKNEATARPPDPKGRPTIRPV